MHVGKNNDINILETGPNSDSLIAETAIKESVANPQLKTSLSKKDKLLPFFIVCAMGFGILIDKVFHSFSGDLNKIQIDGTSMPIALGLLVMNPRPHMIAK